MVIFEFITNFWKTGIAQQILNVSANIITILGIIGLYFSIQKYHEEKYRQIQEQHQKQHQDQKKYFENILQAIASIKHQLNFIGEWTSYKEGGYKPENKENWKRDNFLSRIDPLHVIHPIEYSFLKNASLLPGIQDLGADINEKLVGFMQYCKTFNNYLFKIENLIFSRDINKNILLHRKIAEAKQKNISIEEFMKSIDAEEQNFAETLFRLYVTLHFDIIGYAETKALHYWHKELKNSLEENENVIIEKYKALLTI